jgi:glutathione peroxidase
MSKHSIYEFSANDIKGKPVSLDKFKGKVLLVVNTASQCGFTPQYDGLEKLHQDYQAKGLVVLGFPCNQFGAQEPGDEAQIQEFCKLNHGVTFPLMSKVDVNGPTRHPLYEFLSQAAPGLLGSEGIKWNFTKFLIGKDGQTVKRFAPQDTPASMAKEIEKLLA